MKNYNDVIEDFISNCRNEFYNNEIKPFLDKHNLEMREGNGETFIVIKDVENLKLAFKKEFESNEEEDKEQYLKALKQFEQDGEVILGDFMLETYIGYGNNKWIDVTGNNLYDLFKGLGEIKLLERMCQFKKTLSYYNPRVLSVAAKEIALKIKEDLKEKQPNSDIIRYYCQSYKDTSDFYALCELVRYEYMKIKNT